MALKCTTANTSYQNTVEIGPSIERSTLNVVDTVKTSVHWSIESKELYPLKETDPLLLEVRSKESFVLPERYTSPC